MRRVSPLQYVGAIRDDPFSLSVVQHGRCQEADARVIMFVVVPLERGLRTTSVDAGKKMRKVLHTLDTGGAHTVTIAELPNLKRFQVHPNGTSG